jgi:hypothetical protein
MTSSAFLSGQHRRTYETIFQHPVSHNLEWREVHALFRHIGDVKEESNGNLKVKRNGQTLVLRPSRSKDVAETDELMELRHFLERSEAAPATGDGAEAHWLLVIDHREARLFRSKIRGSVAEEILPYNPEGYFRHAHHSRDFTRGEEKPDPNSFFEPVAAALQASGRILIFGTGTGMSSEMDQFTAWLRLHHPALVRRIIGSQVIDEHHLTEGQLLARARDFYASHKNS